MPRRHWSCGITHINRNYNNIKNTVGFFNLWGLDSYWNCMQFWVLLMTASCSRRCSVTEQPNGRPCVFNSSCRKKKAVLLCKSVLLISARDVFTEEENKTEWLSLLGLYRCKFRISDNSSTYIRWYHTVYFYNTVYSWLVSELALFLFASRLSIVLNRGGAVTEHSRGSFLKLRFSLWMKEVWCLYTFLV